MSEVKWDKKIVLDIIQAGYLRLAKKMHPDQGGSHEEMLALKASRDYLEAKILHGEPKPFYQSDRTRTHWGGPRRGRTYWRDAQSPPPPPPDPDEDNPIPLKPYPHDRDYMQLEDVVIMGVTEKAFKVKITGVKTPQWLPKSQMLWETMNMDDLSEGDTATVVFTRWIARQKGWMK